MAINYFIGWSREDLEAELRAAQEDLASGSALIRSQTTDVGTFNAVQRSNEERVRMLLKALNSLAPADYPIDQVTAITSTRIAFGTPQNLIIPSATLP